MIFLGIKYNSFWYNQITKSTFFFKKFLIFAFCIKKNCTFATQILTIQKKQRKMKINETVFDVEKVSSKLLFSFICVHTQPPATPSRPLVNKFVKLKFAKIHFFANDSPRRCRWAKLINDFQPLANLICGGLKAQLISTQWHRLGENVHNS